MACLLIAFVRAPVPVAPPAPVAIAFPGPKPQSTARILFPQEKFPTLSLPGGQTRLVRSLLKVRKPLRFGGYVWKSDDVPQGDVWVRVDLSRQTLSVFRAGHEIGTTVILYGTGGKPTPVGTFPIIERAKQHRSTIYDADMPFMLRLTNDGIAIHASNVRTGFATHGCIGIPLAFARLLYDQVSRGDLVAIVGSVA
ncbi:L,D-transpeptidase family protein [Sphingomonas sp. M1-B02]|uniref:L,D-transpeptidase family protein n=1 Tax=Sphingomonas sp. M1-B02 TaxID=3114300 RepID=UPI00223FB3BD|nr:L,D-transpeptidase family protein [Sphingomonas sp. S6-11]UZK67927.1 L,D-transpeptidase family protein [Sphingomonas sp. S6-11]